MCDAIMKDLTPYVMESDPIYDVLELQLELCVAKYPTLYIHLNVIMSGD